MRTVEEIVTAVVVLGVTAVTGCIETPTSTLLTFRRSASTPSVAALSVSVWDGAGLYQPATRLPERGVLSPAAGDVLGTLVVYGTAGQGALRIDVRGLDDSGGVAAEGAAIVALRSGQQIGASILLPPGRLMDRDVDDVPDDLDDCPSVANSSQEDWDEDLQGDACDPRPFSDKDAGGKGEPTDTGSCAKRPSGAGNALQFDGVNDHVPVPRRVSGDFTIEMWLKTTCTGNGKTAWNGVGLAVNTAPRATQKFALSVLEGKLAFTVGEETTVSSVSNVDTGSWVHVAVTRTGSDGTMRVLVDGVEEASGIGTTRPLVDAPTLFIGGSEGASRMYCGTIDELRVWNIARSPAAISCDRARVLWGNESGLVSYYRFDDGAGSLTASDESTNGGTSELGGEALGQQPAWVDSDAPLHL